MGRPKNRVLKYSIGDIVRWYGSTIVCYDLVVDTSPSKGTYTVIDMNTGKREGSIDYLAYENDSEKIA